MLTALKMKQGNSRRATPQHSAMSVLLSLPSLTLRGSGFNPYWGQTLCFRVLVPELALLRFVVKDYDWKSRNDFIGQYTLPWSCMRQGESVLPLPAHTSALAVFLMLSSPPLQPPPRLPPYTPALQGRPQPSPSFHLRAYLHTGNARGG